MCISFEVGVDGVWIENTFSKQSNQVVTPSLFKTIFRIGLDDFFKTMRRRRTVADKCCTELRCNVVWDHTDCPRDRRSQGLCEELLGQGLTTLKGLRLTAIWPTKQQIHVMPSIFYEFA